MFAGGGIGGNAASVGSIDFNGLSGRVLDVEAGAVEHHEGLAGGGSGDAGLCSFYEAFVRETAFALFAEVEDGVGLHCAHLVVEMLEAYAFGDGDVRFSALEVAAEVERFAEHVTSLVLLGDEEVVDIEVAGHADSEDAHLGILRSLGETGGEGAPVFADGTGIHEFGL